MPLSKLRNDQAHLQAPVSEMNISDDVLPVVARQSLQRLADHGASEMSDMQRLGDIRSAVVDDDLLFLLRRRQAPLSVRTRLSHLLQIAGQKCRLQLQIEESRFDRFCRFKHRLLHRPVRARFALRQFRCHRVGNHKRRFVILLCAGHRAIALKLTQIRAV